MSMNCTIYFGVYVDILEKIENPYDDEYESYVCGFKDERFSMIYDGMCGEYCYFGVTFTGIDEDNMYSDHNQAIHIENTEEVRREIIEKLKSMGIETEDVPEIRIVCDYR